MLCRVFNVDSEKDGTSDILLFLLNAINQKISIVTRCYISPYSLNIGLNLSAFAEYLPSIGEIAFSENVIFSFISS